MTSRTTTSTAKRGGYVSSSVLAKNLTPPPRGIAPGARPVQSKPTASKKS